MRIDAGDTTLGTFQVNHYLEPGANYTRSVNIRIPERIYGMFHILVLTDANNQVYEHTSEDDNLGFLTVCFFFLLLYMY